jgi:large repetitive protein
VPFTGTVTLTDQNSDTLGTATVTAAGAIKLVLTDLAPGTYTCTVSYPGDANHTAVTSPSFKIKVNPAATATSLTLSATTGLLTAKVVATPAVLPTGTITFMDGKTVVAVDTLSGSTTATFTPSVTGDYTAVYSGDGNYNGRTSAIRVVVVK